MKAEDEEVAELRVAPSSDSPRKPIKSTAVVKFSAAEAPACFAQLRCNTDLNTPPSNWLSPACGLLSPRTSSGFSSFRMAHRFPDCVGQVDVISDAENIKRLLKIPYSRAPVSLVVHRVENTLLIDELDIHRHLLRAAEFDWRWLRTFFFEHVLLSCRDKALYQRQGTSREALQQRSLVSKFLYHSLLQQPDTGVKEERSQPRPVSPVTSAAHTSWAELPEAQPALPDKAHEFARNVVWTFEDIQMLIGTDMPIFGGSTHPCISLRLRDAKRPISVLTGIDYWLDNLMCNVPEVVMCYHLDGIVQKYELVKTEDLPHLAGSKFSPKLIHDVAQNILSFLKSNATKAGHTYWLFKGKDDDAVKLYDLSSLCGDDPVAENPFTAPVAMLLYRVARNMKQQGSTQLGCIRTLLQNCLSLLDSSKHPQIATSAHFMLADLYVPAGTNPADPKLPEDQPEEEVEEEVQTQEAAETSVELQSLYMQPRYPVPQCTETPAALGGSVEERCRLALRHVARGLECLRVGMEIPEPRMAQPGQPIPMPAPCEDSSAVPVPSPLQPEHNWEEHLHSLLEQKTALVLSVLAHDAFLAEKYAASLRHACSSLAAFAACSKDLLGASMLSLAGDACCLLVQRWTEEASRARELLTKADGDIDTVLQLLTSKEPKESWSPGPLESMQDALQAAISAYSLALRSPGLGLDLQSNLPRKLGNAHNELAVLLMGLASAKIPDHEEQFVELTRDSQVNLEAALAWFEQVADSVNLAFVLANCGRLERLRASIRVPLGPQERENYAKAVSSYERAMQTLGGRHDHEAMWDSLAWDLSSTLYNLAVALQEYPPPSVDPERAEREASEALLRALHSCDIETAGARLPLYQFRAATLHHRLAGLHHRAVRQGNTKFALQLCRRHYERAATALRDLEEWAELLRVQLERVALAEFLAEGTTSAGARRRALHSALEELLACELRDLGSEELGLVRLLEQRLLGLLLSLAKLQPKSGPDYKAMYAEALRSRSTQAEESPESLVARLAQLLASLSARLNAK